MHDPLAFLRKIMRDTDKTTASADIPTLTRVADPAAAAGPQLSSSEAEKMVDKLVSDYLPIIEHELRRRLREQLIAQED